MKNKIIKCLLCNQSIFLQNYKSHLLCNHLDIDLKKLIIEFKEYGISKFSENERNIIYEKFYSKEIKDSEIIKFVLNIKYEQYERKVSQLIQSNFIDGIREECYVIISNLEKLKDDFGITEMAKINRMTANIKEILVLKPSEKDFYLNTDICIFCKNRIQKSRMVLHLLKKHKKIETYELEKAISDYELEVSSLERHTLNKRKIEEQDEKMKLKKRLEQENERNVNLVYYSIEKEIDDLKNADYIEIVKFQIDALKLRLKLLLDNIKYGKQEEKKNYHLNEILNEIEKNLPSKEEFINNYCQKIYITWDDIYFERNKIFVTANKGIVQPIPLKGTLSILNEIKVEYFRRVFKSDVFKLILKNGQIRQDLTKDLFKIEEHINEHFKEIHTVKNWHSVSRESIFRDSESKEEILKYINNHTLKNSFLKYPATLLLENDSVRALLEVNNGIEEEVILFIFKKDEYGFLLWENIYSKRAAYIFCFSIKSLSMNIPKIVQLITTNSDYKRENLFKGVDLQKTYNISCIFYKSIIHDYFLDYKNNLDRILK